VKTRNSTIRTTRLKMMMSDILHQFTAAVVLLGAIWLAFEAVIWHPEGVWDAIAGIALASVLSAVILLA
jgi:hypothetical protein